MAAENGAHRSVGGVEFDRCYLLLGLIPVLVYLLMYLVLARTRPVGIGFEIIDVFAFGKVAAAEAHFRYLWVSAFLLSCAVSLAVAVGCSFSLWGDTPPRDRRFIFILMSVVAAIFVLVESSPDLPGQARWYDAMGDGLYRAIFGRLPAGPEAGNLLELLESGLDLIKACGAVALTLITAALILTLARMREAEPLERRAEFLARMQERQRACLQQGATVYVFALIAMLSWMYWPLPFLADEQTGVDYRQLLVGSSVLQGVSYSLGIAAIYLPPALLLRRRAVRLAGEAAGDGAGTEDWLREKGLSAQPLDQLRQVAALLMPTLVGVLPALTELWR